MADRGLTVGGGLTLCTRGMSYWEGKGAIERRKGVGGLVDLPTQNCMDLQD